MGRCSQKVALGVSLAYSVRDLLSAARSRHQSRIVNFNTEPE